MMKKPTTNKAVKSKQDEEGVTGCFCHHIKPGCEASFKNWHKQLIATQQTFTGFIKTECFRSGMGGKNEWIDFSVFKTQKNLEAWLRSEEREEIISKLKPWVKEMYYHQLSSGFDSWFIQSNRIQVPANWKIALTVVLGLYPTVMFIAYFINPQLSGLPFAATMLIGNFISVAALQWMVMPMLNYLLSPWLLPEQRSVLRSTLVTIGIFAILLLMAWACWPYF